MAITVYQGSCQVPHAERGVVVTIGNFDGVHRGHQALLRRAMELGASVGLDACAFTFDPAPRDVLRPENSVPRIQSLEDRLSCLEATGVQRVVVEPFDRAYAARDAAWFASEVLAGRLGARGVVVGWDFRFGRGRTGSLDTLAAHVDGPVEQLAPVTMDGDVISSSRVRGLVREGEVEAAAALLSREHVVMGPVVDGDKRGRTLGFPTANVRPQTALVPAHGVYAVRVDTGDGRWRPGVCNLGLRPTFDATDAQLEVHLLDFSGDLYGRTLRVAFVSRLRAERTFDSVDALTTQIALDVAAAREKLHGD